MKKNRWTGYDRYLVLADSSRTLRGTYASYINFKQVLEVLNNLVTKRTTQYLYNGAIFPNPRYRHCFYSPKQCFV